MAHRMGPIICLILTHACDMYLHFSDSQTLHSNENPVSIPITMQKLERKKTCHKVHDSLKFPPCYYTYPFYL